MSHFFVRIGFIRYVESSANSVRRKKWFFFCYIFVYFWSESIEFDVIYIFIYIEWCEQLGRVRTGLESFGKLWKFIMPFSMTWKVLEKEDFSNWLWKSFEPLFGKFLKIS